MACGLLGAGVGSGVRHGVGTGVRGGRSIPNNDARDGLALPRSAVFAEAALSTARIGRCRVPAFADEGASATSLGRARRAEGLPGPVQALAVRPAARNASRANVCIRARRTGRARGCGVLSQTAILATEGPGGRVTILGTNQCALQVGDLALASGRNALGGSRVARGRHASGGARDQHHERDCAANEADATSHAVQFRRICAQRPHLPRGASASRGCIRGFESRSRQRGWRASYRGHAARRVAVWRAVVRPAAKPSGLRRAR
jgi:hypothetical protein